MGRASRCHRHRSAHFWLRMRQAFLASVVSFTGVSAGTPSSEISSRYRSTWFSDVLASVVATNTSWSGVRRPESVVATSVDGYSSTMGVRGVPSWKGSVSG
jgi:hypothetical protein